MATKNKKSKGHRTKLSDDLSNISNTYINNFNENNYHPNYEDEELGRKRNFTKVSKKHRSTITLEYVPNENTGNEKVKKVKFSKIDVIKVESWKKYNLSLTADENLEELLNVSKGRKEKDKNVSCTCTII